MNLSEFLLARFAEEEAVATAARGDELAYSSRPPYAKLGFAAGDLAQRFNPARVLAECEAKRRVVEMRLTYEGRPQEGEPQGSVSAIAVGTVVLDAVLRALALPYADHPDYHEEWRA